MTIAASFWRRSFPRLPQSTPRLFEVEPGTRMRGDCHWQKDPAAHPTLLLLHGLEGSSDSGYMLGTAEKAWIAGLNVVRLNQRNCGGTEKLTPTLYHSGRSDDIHAIVLELIERDQLPEIFTAGFSMGGNLVLKMAGELSGSAPPQLRGIVAIAPCFDLAACVNALGESRNFIYQRHFVRRLKNRMRYKASLFPKVYALDAMHRIRSVRDFDELITAPHCGFEGADDYYDRSSAMHVLAKIQTPTLLLTAQDDPFVPFSTFESESIRENPNIELVAPPSGGHCAFISEEKGEGRFWSETRIVEFCEKHSRVDRARQKP